jgi:LDH2 family malate/lactate/ureidoglycolate dehydrogenase
MTNVDAALAHRQIVAVLTSWGMPAATAAQAAGVMVDTDLSGIDSHGIGMLEMYEQLRDEGRLSLAAEPEVVRDLPALAVLDAHEGLGHPVAIDAMRRAIEKARTCGIGAVAVRGSNHFGALGYYARLAVDEGCIALVTTSTRTPVAAATNGTSPVLGTNPLAFAAPRSGGEPLVVDMSTSVVALNKVKAYGLRGKPLPHGWVSDRQGEPLHDGLAAYDMLRAKQATISTLGGPSTETGGHKGFGLSLMVQVLSAALSNAAQPVHDGPSDNLGHFMLAIDPSLLGDDGSADYVATLLESMQAGEPAVRIPGDPEREMRAERGRDGIPIPDSLWQRLEALAARAGAPFVLGEARDAD